jgi:hypothetical protein
MSIETLPQRKPIENFVTRRQGGRLVMGREFPESDPDAALALFSRFIVMDARAELVGGNVEYTGYSPDFRPLMLGERIPRYQAIFQRQPDGSIDVKLELDPREPRP